MKKVYLLLQTLQEKFSSFTLRQRVSLIVTIFVLLAIPITLTALKYQQIFRSKAAGQFGRIVVYEPGMETESNGVADTNSPDGQGFSKIVNSSLVTLHIYFPDWNQTTQQTQTPNQNHFASFVSKVSAQTNGGCADSNGDRHLSDGSAVKCTNYDGTGTITKKEGENFQYDTRCENERFLNNYYWSSCQSGGGSSGGSDNPPPLSNTGNTEGACADSSGKRHFSDGTVGVCTNYDGTGSITQKEGENFQYDTRCESSRFLDNYWWKTCPKGTSTSYPNNNTNTPSKPTLGSRCNVSDTSTCGPVSGEGGKQLYCRQFDDDPDGGIWVEKQDTLGRCARGEVRKAVQACNPRVYTCQDGQWVVDTFQLVGPGGVAGIGTCCKSESAAQDCGTGAYCDTSAPDGRCQGLAASTRDGKAWVCKAGGSGGGVPTSTPAFTQPQSGSVPLGGNCQQTQECATGVCANSWDFATSGKCIALNSKGSGQECKDTLECTSNDQSCVSGDTEGAICQTITQKDRGRATGNAGDCKQGLIWQQGVQDSGGNIYDMCLLNAKVPAGQYCIHNRECQSNSCSNNVCIGGNATPKFTRYLLIKNENGDFSNPDNYVSFTFSESDSNGYINNAFLISHYALSQTDPGQKTITVRFCPSSNVEDRECRQQQITVTLVKIVNPPPPQPQVDSLLQSVKDKLERLGTKVTIDSDGITIENEGTINPPPIISFDDSDLEFLVYVLRDKYKIHPYFALCHAFNSYDLDRKRLLKILTRYGVGPPILPAQWTSEQLQALNDPLYKDPQGGWLRYGRGPLALPCDFNIDKPETFAIFPLLRNAPSREYLQQLIQSGFGNLPDIDFSNVTQRRYFEEKLAALVVLEQLTWEAASIPIGTGVDWAVQMAEAMPITTNLPTLALIWKYILPGDSIVEALKLNDKGAPLGFTAASYGGKIIGSIALLAVPVGGIPGVGGRVGGERFVAALDKLAEQQIIRSAQKTTVISFTHREIIDGVEQGVIKTSSLLDNPEEITVFADVFDLFKTNKKTVRLRIGRADPDIVKLKKLLGATDRNGVFYKVHKYPDNSAKENGAIDKLNTLTEYGHAFPISRTSLGPYFYGYLQDVQQSPLYWYASGQKLIKITEVFERRYMFVGDRVTFRTFGMEEAHGFAAQRIIILSLDEFYDVANSGIISRDLPIFHTIRHEIPHAISMLDGDITFASSYKTAENPRVLGQLLFNMYELETDVAASFGRSRLYGNYQRRIPDFNRDYTQMKKEAVRATNGRFSTYNFTELAYSGDDKLLANRLSQYPEAKRVFQRFLSSYGIDYRGTIFK